MNRIPLAIALVFVALLTCAAPSFAFKIEEVTSPGGIKAWLVPNHGIPLIAMKYSFKSGSADDPAGKEGVANFLTGMMDEGAADLDSAAFQKQRDQLSFKMSFDAGLDGFEGSFQTLTRNRDASFELLRKAVSAPHFDPEPLERVRQQFLVSIRDRDEDPEQIGAAAWMNLAVPHDPYGREQEGTIASVSAISAADLGEALARIFNRSTLQVAVVGDISASELGPLLDRVFGGLPDNASTSELAAPKLADGPLVKIIDRDIPQSIIFFGSNGILRSDPDFIQAFVLMEILGGDGFSARLTNEIREKRGLTYGVGAGLSPLRRIGFIVGSMSTRNEKAAEAITLIKQEISRMAEEGPTQQELDEAKTYLTGSYALRFDSHISIANQLLAIQQEKLGLDYVETRNARIEAVTLAEVKAQAKRLLHSDKLLVTIVGKPAGL